MYKPHGAVQRYYVQGRSAHRVRGRMGGGGVRPPPLIFSTKKNQLQIRIKLSMFW